MHRRSFLRSLLAGAVSLHYVTSATAETPKITAYLHEKKNMCFECKTKKEYDHFLNMHKSEEVIEDGIRGFNAVGGGFSMWFIYEGDYGGNS
jgi:hypothetical protein